MTQNTSARRMPDPKVRPAITHMDDGKPLDRSISTAAVLDVPAALPDVDPTRSAQCLQVTRCVDDRDGRPRRDR